MSDEVRTRFARSDDSGSFDSCDHEVRSVCDHSDDIYFNGGGRPPSGDGSVVLMSSFTTTTTFREGDHDGER